MKKLLQKLEGKKTYLVAILVGVVSVLNYLGVVDGQAYVTIMGLLGAGGVAALRAAK